MVIVLAWAATALSPSISTANEIYITQSGDDFVFESNQVSDDNKAYALAFGKENNIKINQGMHDDGSIDSDETGGHYAYWYLFGDTNTVESHQTDTNRSGGGGDSHFLSNYVFGDGNTVEHIQMGKAGHDGYVYIDGDSNDVYLYQRGNGGKKYTDIELTGNGHAVDIDQRGSHYASADIDLTNSGGAYDLNLSQNVTSSTGTYSITGICYTANGCAVTVNGNN